MSDFSRQILEKVENLNVFRRGDRRAPHKPLLLLIALANLKRGENRASLADIEKQLLPLLKIYAPPVSGRHQPELPYWHLQSDGLWEIEGADSLPRQRGGFPRLPALRETSAGFPQDIAKALSEDEKLSDTIVHHILEEHFPPSLHDDIIAAVGFDELSQDEAVDQSQSLVKRRARDPHFRNKVLRAYEHRCAVTGFRAALGGAFFGCEAAHVQWHAYEGRDEVDNGICLEPTIHKLFDAGAWTLTDNRIILVSAEYTGSDSAIHRLREKHGRPLEEPIAGKSVAQESIEWHREPDLGGVFRHPALQL